MGQISTFYPNPGPSQAEKFCKEEIRMRNLKRALSLTLASVMLLGMMVIGTSAAAGYDDVKENDNVEAIEVLQAVEVMVGDDRGFGPDRPVTRNEMAVVMGKLLNLNYNYYASTCPFTDVAEWAKGWVGACAANGIVSGRGDGIYDGEATVTAIEAASMMMRALGYFKYTEDYDDGFQLVTVRQGSEIGIFNGVGTDGNTPMTRNQVAQMALNALRSNMVSFTGTPGIEVNGVKVGYRAEYTPRTGTEAKYRAISPLGNTTDGTTNQSYIQLGEELYDGDLKLYDNRTDAFGRPSRHWEYDGKGIGTYIKTELLKDEYTTKVTGKMLYELLGKDVVDDYNFSIAIDGETEKGVLNSVATGEKDQYFFTETALNRSNTNQVGGTDKGVLTQVFVDGNSKEVYISVINTYLAKADSDYNAKRDEAAFTIWNVTRVTSGSTKALVKDDANNVSGEKVSGEDFDVEDVKSGDIVLVRVAENEIQEILAPEVISDAEISAFRNGSYVVSGSTQYDYASTARYDDETLDDYSQDNMKDTTYRIFLDPYGYLVGIEKIDGETHYVFLTGINSNTENLKDQTAIGNVVFLDGSSKNVTIDMKGSENAQGNSFNEGDNDTAGTGVSSLMNTWCTYSVNDDNVYTLKEVANTAGTVDAAGNKAGQSHMGGTYGDENDSAFADCGTSYAEDHDTVKYPHDNSAADAGSLTFGQDDDGTSEKYVTINKGHVSLEGIAGSAAYKKVYGNNDTIYLSAETDIITAKTALVGGDDPDTTNEPENQKAIIITGASSVSVGVQRTDLKAWNAQAVVNSDSKYQKNGMFYENVSDGVYTLFNDKGYVIAAMVIGSDDGSSTSYAWVSSGSMNREGYGSGKWTYSRDVIVDGKEATLTEDETNGTKTPDIGATANFASGDGQRSLWWEVKTKSDGTVKSVNKITASTSNYDYITDIDDDDKDGTTILEQKFNLDDGSKVGGPFKVRVTGSTLQVESRTGDIRGFAVAPDAGIAVVKDERIYRNDVAQNEWNYKEDIEYFTNDDNAGGLKSAVSYLTDSDDFTGYIAAVLKDGRAECVVLYDKADDDVDIGGSGVGGDLYVQESTEGVIDITTTKSLSAREVAGVVRNFLNDSDIDTVTYDSKTKEATVTYNNGDVVVYDVTVNAVSSANEVAAAEMMNKVQAAINNASSAADRPNPKANISISGNTMTVNTTNGDKDYFNAAANNQSMHDLARFMGKLHDAGAEEIMYDGDTFEWDTTQGGNSKSHWYDSTNSVTLIAAIVSDHGSTVQGWSDTSAHTLTLSFTVDGMPMSIVLDLSAA